MNKLNRILYITISIIGLCFAVFFIFQDFTSRIIANTLVQRKLANEVKIVVLQDFDMKDTLRILKNNKNIFEIEGIYNEEKVEFLKSGKSSLNTKTKLATQYLLAGYPDSTLFLLDEIYNKNNFFKNVFLKIRFASLPTLKSTLFSSYLFDQNWGNENFQRGLCYLRIAEQKNCQSNHSSSSCILPFDEYAIHKKIMYGEKAIEYFSNHISKNPGDKVALWLLNISYMTIGKYPESVPSDYLIDFNYFSNESLFVNKFYNVASNQGVDFVSLYGGAIIDDFNNDGLLDIFTTSGDLHTNVKLYINNGKEGFIDFTASAGLKGITGGVNAVQADYNNDGNLDIYVIRGGWLNKEGTKHPNSLLRNNGDGTFSDVTNESGLLTFWASHTACWADINNDGYLDLFVGNERALSQLFLNNGNGTFKEIALDAGLKINEYVKGAVWIDYDNDGLQDLYISTYLGENKLFKNLGVLNKNSKIPKFKNVTKEAGVKEPFYSFPVATLDFNNDGFQDLLVADFTLSIKEFVTPYINGKTQKIHPALYINNGDGTFTNKWRELTFPKQTLSMGLNIGDVDNDGFQDIYFGTGYPDLAALSPNLLYINDNAKALYDITMQSGLGHLQKGHAIAFGDLNNNGYQDIYASFGGWYSDDTFYNALFENNNSGNNWIKIKLEGVKSNRSAIGAKIKIIVSNDGRNKRSFYRVISNGSSYGANPIMAEIGIGNANQIEEIEISWPNKNQTKQYIYNACPNTFISILEN
jgi:hypothetical protein